MTVSRLLPECTELLLGALSFQLILEEPQHLQSMVSGDVTAIRASPTAVGHHTVLQLAVGMQAHVPHMREEERVVRPHKRANVRDNFGRMLYYVAQEDQQLNDAEQVRNHRARGWFESS